MLSYIYPDNKLLHSFKHEQGFLTSDDKFVDRIEGAKIASKAGQTSEHVIVLYSENLY
jgi:hypothetical protein